MEYEYSETLARLAKLIAEQTLPSFELWEPVSDIIDWRASEQDCDPIMALSSEAMDDARRQREASARPRLPLRSARFSPTHCELPTRQVKSERGAGWLERAPFAL